LSPQILD